MWPCEIPGEETKAETEETEHQSQDKTNKYEVNDNKYHYILSF